MTAGRAAEWFDDESLWRDLYAFLFSEERFTDAPEQVRRILTLTKPKGNAVLDLCCGPGRCSIPLAKEGYSVTAVDSTRFLLDKGRAMAREAGVEIEWIRRDMRDFVRPNSFDLALNMFTSFGFFKNKQEDITVLHNVITSLRPGGIFLIDVLGKECLARIFQPTIPEALPDGSVLIQHGDIIEDWTRVRNVWFLIRSGKVKKFNFDLTIYSGQELRDRMEQVGFVDVKLFGNLKGDEYGFRSERLIAIGRRRELEP